MKRITTLFIKLKNRSILCTILSLLLLRCGYKEKKAMFDNNTDKIYDVKKKYNNGCNCCSINLKNAEDDLNSQKSLNPKSNFYKLCDIGYYNLIASLMNKEGTDDKIKFIGKYINEKNFFISNISITKILYKNMDCKKNIPIELLQIFQNYYKCKYYCINLFLNEKKDSGLSIRRKSIFEYLNKFKIKYSQKELIESIKNVNIWNFDRAIHPPNTIYTTLCAVNSRPDRKKYTKIIKYELSKNENLEKRFKESQNILGILEAKCFKSILRESYNNYKLKNCINILEEEPTLQDFFYEVVARSDSSILNYLKNNEIIELMEKSNKLSLYRSGNNKKGLWHYAAEHSNLKLLCMLLKKNPTRPPRIQKPIPMLDSTDTTIKYVSDILDSEVSSKAVIKACYLNNQLDLCINILEKKPILQSSFYDFISSINEPFWSYNKILSLLKKIDESNKICLTWSDTEDNGLWHYAAKYANFDFLRALHNYIYLDNNHINLDINKPNRKGNMPIHIAFKSNERGIYACRFLVEFTDANISDQILDEEYKTVPFIFKEMLGRHKLLGYLRGDFYLELNLNSSNSLGYSAYKGIMRLASKNCILYLGTFTALHPIWLKSYNKKKILSPNSRNKNDIGIMLRVKEAIQENQDYIVEQAIEKSWICIMICCLKKCIPCAIETCDNTTWCGFWGVLIPIVLNGAIFFLLGGGGPFK